MSQKNAKDYTGLKIGKLTFVRPTEQRRKSGNIVWETICDCGGTCFLTPSEARSDNNRGCGCRRSETGLQSRKYDPKISSARSVWRPYGRDGCDFETFLLLSQQPCYYCGSAPYKSFNIGLVKLNAGEKVSAFALEDGYFIYNGLDRLDSSKLHTTDNIVPCCYRCNCAKNDMSFDEFISHIRKMYEHTQQFRQVQSP